MNPSRQAASAWMSRASLLALLLAAGAAGAWMAADLLAQDRPGQGRPSKPRVEEEDDPAAAPKPGTKKSGRPRVEEEEGKPPRVRSVDENETPEEPGAQAPSGNLRQAAESEKNPLVKQLFQELAVPHDHLFFNPVTNVASARGQKDEYVEPVPYHMTMGTEKPNVKVIPIKTLEQRDWKPVKEDTVSPKSIASIQPYEEIAESKVTDFLKKHLDEYPADDTRHLTRFQQLQKAEQVLSAVLLFHESAWERGLRKGPGWDGVKKHLRSTLLKEVMLPQLRSLKAANDSNALYALTRRLAATYVHPEERKQIAEPLAQDIQRLLTSDSPLEEGRQSEALQRLHYLEEQFPSNPVVEELSKRMQTRAEKLLEEARRLARNPDTLQAAQDCIRRAEEIWPRLPGLNAYKTELGQSHPVLRVGMRQLPLFLSPARACTDNDLRVVEMLFEGLVKQSPDGEGLLRYHPALAESMPQVVLLGRHVYLPRNALWDKDRPLGPGDIRFTVGQMRKGRGSGRPSVWGDMLEEVELRGQADQVTLRLRQGFLDPLALLTFKIVPQNSQPDSDEFGRHPIGSGPFRFAGSGEEDQGRRQYMRFTANPYYGSRPSKQGLPRLQEVRLFSYTDAVKELREHRLDVVLDATADEAVELNKQAASLRVRVLTPGPTTVNRRVYFLAVNHRKPVLDNKEVRQALAYAIDRETLLNRHFRGGLTSIHKALNGPFPFHCWARKPDLGAHQYPNSLDLFDPVLAEGHSKKAAEIVRTNPDLTLKYPEGDTALKEALEELVSQVQKTAHINLRLVPRNPHDLRKDVEQTQSYDLAYYHYDYPDETFWLRPLLLGPNVPDSNESYLGFQPGKEVLTALEELRGRRYFPTVQDYMHRVHGALLGDMPIIPLWQLDPLIVLHEDVQTPPFDPQLVFTDIELWKLQRR